MSGQSERTRQTNYAEQQENKQHNASMYIPCHFSPYRSSQMLDISCFARMGSVCERVESLGVTELVQRSQVRVHVVRKQGVVGIQGSSVVNRIGAVVVVALLALALVIHRVEPDQAFQKHVKLGVHTRVYRDFKERHEDVVKHFLEGICETWSKRIRYTCD